MIDDENARQGPPTRLELLAEELGVDADTYRDLLHDADPAPATRAWRSVEQARWVAREEGERR